MREASLLAAGVFALVEVTGALVGLLVVVAALVVFTADGANVVVFCTTDELGAAEVGATVEGAELNCVGADVVASAVGGKVDGAEVGICVVVSGAIDVSGAVVVGGKVDGAPDVGACVECAVVVGGKVDGACEEGAALVTGAAEDIADVVALLVSKVT